MKILDEEFGAIGRWYIALPPLLLIAFLVGLFFLAAAGQLRSNSADETVHASEMRLRTLSEFISLITDAEAAQRGYLLTGEPSYLKPYNDALGRIEPTLERLRNAYAGVQPNAPELPQLDILTGKMLGELEETTALAQRRGAAPAVSVVRTDVARRSMEQVMGHVASLRQRESNWLRATTAQWQADLRLSHWITLAGAVLNIGLVVLASGLVYGDMRRRSRQTTRLRDQKEDLEQQVDARTRELTALSTHLQGVSEREKSALARELHDELGGLLVAARMDVSWLQRRLNPGDAATLQRFTRIHEYLSAGVDLKRRVVEELRPTLLDNMGLFAALRWQFKESCRRTGMNCSESIPDTELDLDPEAAIGVFRIAQEALTNIVKHAAASAVDLTVDLQRDTFVLRIADDGKGIAPNRLKTSTAHGMASMRHRIAALGGAWDAHSPSSGGTIITARVPLARILAAAPISELPGC